MMTTEQRVILELSDVLAVRLECVRCGAAVILKPTDWREAPFECPGCHNTWELPSVPNQAYSPINQLGLGIRRLLEIGAGLKPVSPRDTAGPAPMPYRVKVEIRDPLAQK
jgi:hypothetical protein